MSERPATPPPWKLEADERFGLVIKGPYGYVLAKLYLPSIDDPLAELTMGANGELMARAPELERQNRTLRGALENLTAALELAALRHRNALTDRLGPTEDEMISFLQAVASARRLLEEVAG